MEENAQGILALFGGVALFILALTAAFSCEATDKRDSMRACGVMCEQVGLAPEYRNNDCTCRSKP